MASNSLDIRHLRIFLALHAAKNVSRAAEQVGLSQSSVSIALGQLREHYNDPLFVRTSGGMRATPRAEQLASPIRQALHLLDGSLTQVADFEPAKMRRRFRISMTDVGQMTLLPRLLLRIHQAAPHATVEVSNLTFDTAQQLESGEVDLAMGFTTDIKAGFYQQKLFDEGFACLVAQDHPRACGRMTLAQLQDEKHVKVLVSATAHTLIDRFLESKGLRREFVVTVPTFLGLSELIASTAFVAIVPLRLAAILEQESGVKIAPVASRFPSYAVKQYWHDRYHRDAANIWLRSVVYETANQIPLPSGTSVPHDPA